MASVKMCFVSMGSLGGAACAASGARCGMERNAMHSGIEWRVCLCAHGKEGDCAPPDNGGLAHSIYSLIYFLESDIVHGT
jgi:hypothetical protein